LRSGLLQNNWPLAYGPGLKAASLFKPYLLPEFLSYGDIRCIFGTLTTGAKMGANLFIFGVGTEKVGGFSQKRIFRTMAFSHKMDPLLANSRNILSNGSAKSDTP